MASYLEFEGGNCSCGLGPVSLRFVPSLGSGWMLGPWIEESIRFSEILMTWFLLVCHMCEMDVDCLEWEGRDGESCKDLGCGKVRVRPAHTFHLVQRTVLG